MLCSDAQSKTWWQVSYHWLKIIALDKSGLTLFLFNSRFRFFIMWCTHTYVFFSDLLAQIVMWLSSGSKSRVCCSIFSKHLFSEEAPRSSKMRCFALDFTILMASHSACSRHGPFSTASHKPMMYCDDGVSPPLLLNPMMPKKYWIVVKIIFSSFSAQNTSKRSSQSFLFFVLLFHNKKNVSYMIHWALVHGWQPATTQQSLVVGGKAVTILVETEVHCALYTVGERKIVLLPWTRLAPKPTAAPHWHMTNTVKMQVLLWRLHSSCVLFPGWLCWKWWPANWSFPHCHEWLCYACLEAAKVDVLFIQLEAVSSIQKPGIDRCNHDAVVK